MILTGQTRLRFGSVWFTLVVCAVKITFGSLWFNMASVDIKKYENKYDYPDNYELQQHQRSSVAVEWYKNYITTVSSTVLLGPIHKYAHDISLAPYLCDGDFSASLSLLMFKNHS